MAESKRRDRVSCGKLARHLILVVDLHAGKVCWASAGRALNTKKSRYVLPLLNPQQNEVGVTP